MRARSAKGLATQIANRFRRNRMDSDVSEVEEWPAHTGTYRVVFTEPDGVKLVVSVWRHGRGELK